MDQFPLEMIIHALGGSIDVDRYNIQHKEVISVIRKRKYPLIPFRSKV